jgi:TolB-like protein
MLAVLPFEHAGPSEQAVFTDGLTDAVTAKLVALPGLAIIDRQSAAQYRHTTKPAKQIGTELGVTWLLEGVVRWARGAGGAWQAQVTPTLVDARSGTTRWTGAPVVITPADPFTAQGDIATRVAQALAVELRPDDRASLARRLTSDPEAFAAWVRGLAALEASSRESSSDAMQQAAREFAHAVDLDSTFAAAWGELAQAQSVLNFFSAGDRSAEARMRATYERALVHAPEQPQVLLSLAWAALDYDHDTTAADTLAARALAAAPNDPDVLRRASGLLSARQRHDTAYALARRAALLAPRSGRLLTNAALLAVGLRRWEEGRRYADAVTALDSADPRGWAARLDVVYGQGDTVALGLELDRALAHVTRPDNRLLWFMSQAGGSYGARFLALSAREQGVTTMYDSVFWYYDAKADVWLRRGEPIRANVYYDSVRSLLAGRVLGGALGPDLLAARALSEAALGDRRAARRTLSAALAAARRTALRADLTDVLSTSIVAAAYGHLGEPETAVRWLEAGIAAPGGWTARGYARDPKLFVLRGAPAFERFLRAHP